MVFLGTPGFAVPALRAVASSCDVAMVITRPDRPRGRGLASAESEVARAARGLGAPLLKPTDVNDPATLGTLRGLEADLFAVVAFGSILSRAALETPRLGCVNLHGSLLPLYRGASPVQRALWDGRVASGVTTLWMDDGVDTGDLILQRWEPIQPEDDAASLAARLADVGAPLLAQSLVLAARGQAPRRSQPKEGGSYARKLAKADGAIEWTLDAETVWHHQRAVTPWPGATTTMRGRPLLVTRSRPLHELPGDAPGTLLGLDDGEVAVACGRGALRLERVKPEGRPEMSGGEWSRGARLAPGERLGAVAESTA